MIRDYVLQQLRSEFGAPMSNEASEWWITGEYRRHPVHICLNERLNGNAAHVLIFDPDRIDGHSVIEVSIHNVADADALFERIRRIANPRRYDSSSSVTEVRSNATSSSPAQNGQKPA